MVPVVAIVGRSKAGKTTVIEGLIGEFKKRGYRVAAVKHAHQPVEMDTQGKDTWHFAQAGCDVAAISSPSKITIFKNTVNDPAVEEILSSLGNEYDIVLLEGFKQSKVPKIEVYRGEPGEELVCPEDKLMAVISDARLTTRLPLFGTGEIKPIADFIEKEIINKVTPDISVSINGKRVFMKPFVKEIIARTIIAMLSTLKNVGIIKSVNISMTNAEVKSEEDV